MSFFGFLCAIYEGKWVPNNIHPLLRLGICKIWLGEISRTTKLENFRNETQWRITAVYDLTWKIVVDFSLSQDWQFFFGRRSQWPQSKFELLKALTSAYEKCSLWSHSFSLVGLHFEGREHRLKLNVITLNAMMSSFEKGSQWQLALQQITETSDLSGLQPNRVTFNAIISSFARVLQWQLALLYLERMRKTSRPDVISYTAVLNALSSSERGPIFSPWEQAIELFDRMMSERVSPNVLTYNALLVSCEKASQWQRTLLYFFQFFGSESLKNETTNQNAANSPDVLSLSTAIGSSVTGSQKITVSLISWLTHKATFIMKTAGFVGWSWQLCHYSGGFDRNHDFGFSSPPFELWCTPLKCKTWTNYNDQ